jgi:hypothetical protein
VAAAVAVVVGAVVVVPLVPEAALPAVVAAVSSACNMGSEIPPPELLVFSPKSTAVGSELKLTVSPELAAPPNNVERPVDSMLATAIFVRSACDMFCSCCVFRLEGRSPAFERTCRPAESALGVVDIKPSHLSYRRIGPRPLADFDVAADKPLFHS